MILLVVDIATAAALVPRVVENLHAHVPPDLAQGVGDARLLDLSLRIGAYLSVPAYAFVIVVFALVARSLERHVFSPSRQLGSFVRVGAFWTLMALMSAPVNVAQLLSTGGWRGSAGRLVYVVSALLFTFLLFWRDWRRLPPSRMIMVAAVACAFALAMTFGR